MLSKLRIQLFEKHNKRQIITLIILSFFLFSLEIHSQTNEKLKAISIDKKDISTVPLDSTLKETSSLYYDNRLLWSNNDDKDNRLYGINLNTGSIEQIVEFNKLKVVDWEETQQDSLYYFLGDFGNNGKGNRQNLMFFKIRKSDLTIDTIQFHYPEQTDFSIQKSNRTNFDCEAFIIHDSNIYLFTKEWKSTQTSLYKIPTTPGKHVAQKMGSLNVRGLITGATINPDKTKIILSGYTKMLAPFLIYLSDFNENNFFNGSKNKLKIPRNFLQIEGIAFIDENKIAVSNEYFNKAFINQPQSLTIIDLTNYIK